MEEIKVGEYVRTEFGNIGIFYRPASENADVYYIYIAKDGTKISSRYDSIVNHGFDIKDLVQAGDIIKYKQYKFSKFYDIELVREYTDARTQKKYLGVKGFRLKESQIEIKEILTKEQFNQMKYIVGGE